MDDNTQSWLDFSQRPFDQGGLGLAQHQAAGIVGNLQAESGRGIPSWGPTGDNRTAWGSAQWRNERLTGLQKFAAANGMDPRSVQAQQAWMRNELTSTHAGAFDALRAAQTPQDAATAFNRHYEISADRSGRREANAAALMGGNPLAAINGAAGITQPRGGPALAFSGEDDETPASATPTSGSLTPGPGVLSFNDGGSGRKDNRFGIGDLFGASDETKEKMHGIGARLVRAAAAASAGVNPAQAAQFNSLGKSLEEQNKTDYQYMMGPNGQVIKINKDTGAVNVATLPGGGAQSFTPHFGKDASGNDVYKGRFNARTGEWIAAAGGQASKSPYGENVTAENPYGLPADMESLKEKGPAGNALYNQLQGIKAGNIQYPTGSRVNKQMEMLRNAASTYFPDLNQNDFAARKRYQEDNNKQNPGSIGGNKIALNHSYNVLGQISDKMVALDNSDNAYVPAGIQGTYNNLRNQSNAKHPAANSLDTQLGPALAGETGKLYYGQGAGGQAEREKISKGLTSYGTKSDQISGLETALATLQAREADIDNQAKQAYGKDADKYAARSADGHKDIEKLKTNLGILKGELNKDGTPKSIPQTATAKPGAIPSSWDDAQKAGWK